MADRLIGEGAWETVKQTAAEQAPTVEPETPAGTFEQNTATGMRLPTPSLGAARDFDFGWTQTPAGIKTDAEADRIMVTATAMATQFGDANPGDWYQAATMLEDFIAAEPWARPLIEEDFTTGTQLVTADRIAKAYFDDPELSFGEEVYRAAWDTLSGMKYRASALPQLAAAPEARAEGPYRAVDLSRDEVAEFEQRLSGLYEAEGKAAVGVSLDFDNLRGEQRQVQHLYYPPENRLVSVVTYKSGEQSVFDVLLDEGTVIEDRNDMLWETLLAESGIAHTVQRRDEGIRGRQTIVGLAGDGANSVLSQVDRAWFAVNESAAAGVDAENLAAATRVVGNDLDRNWLVGQLAALHVAQQHEQGRDVDYILAAGQAIDTVEEFTESGQYDELRSATILAAGTSEQEIVENLQAQMDRRGPAIRGRDAFVMGAAEVLSQWDHIVHEFGMRTLAGFEGLLSDIPGLEEVTDLFTPDSMFEGFRSYGEAFADASDASSIAEFYGVEPDSTLGHAINFAGSVIFDPFLWVTPGGKGAAQIAFRRLTTKAGAREAIELPTTRAVADNLYRAIQAGDSRPLLSFMQLDPEHMLRLLNENITSADDVLRIIEDALPANNGHFILDFTGHEHARRTASAIANMARSNDGTVVRWLRTRLGVFPHSGEVSLGNRFFDDVGEQLASWFHNDPEGMTPWLRRFAETYDDFTHNRINLDDVASRLGDVRAERARLITETPTEVRRFESARKAWDETSGEIERLRAAGDDELADLLESGGVQLGDLRARKRDLSQTLAAMRAGSADPTEIQAFAEALQNVTRQLDGLLARLDNGVGGYFRPLDNLPLQPGTRLWDEMFTRSSAYRKTLAEATARRHVLQRAYAYSQLPGNTRVLADTIDDFYEMIGDSLGLERLPYTTGVKRYGGSGRPYHDWGPINGQGRRSITLGDQGATFEDTLRVMAGDEELAEQLSASGLGARASSHPTPARMDHIIAARAMGVDKWSRRLSRLQDPSGLQHITTGFTKLMRGLRYIWVTNLLMNPVTMLRSNMDEIWRLIEETGRTGGRPLSEATVRRQATELGITDERVIEMLANPQYLDVPGPASVGARQFVPQAEPALNTYSNAFNELLLSPYERAMSSGYRVLESTDSGFTRAVRWNVEGLVGNDPVAQMYARAELAGDPNMFFSWWNAEGFRWRRSGHVRYDPARGASGNNVREVTASVAFDSRRELINRLAARFTGVDDARDLLLDVIAGNRQLPEAVARRFDGQIIGLSQGRQGMLERSFQALYGSPGAVRGSLVHQDRFAQVRNTLIQAKEANGKLLTPQRISELSGMPVAQAEQFIASAPAWQMDQIVNHYGLSTTRQIEAIADRVATRYAKSMMYQPGAASMLGRRLQTVFPFAPAHLDYLGWYGRRLTAATELGAHPRVQQAVKAITGREIPTHQIPFNLRLIGRVGEVGGASARIVTDEEENRDALRRGERVPGYDDAAPGDPVPFIGDVTFFPVEFGEMMVVDMFPSPGGVGAIPLYALPILSNDADMADNSVVQGFADGLESIWPALGWNQSASLSNPLGLAVDTLAPDTPMSIRGGVDRSATFLDAFVDLPFIEGATSWASRPLGYERVFKYNLYERLQSDDWTVGGRDERARFTQDLVTEALRTTSMNEWADWVSRIPLLGAAVNADDFLGTQAQAYEPLVDTVDVLVNQGLVGPGDANTLRELWDAAADDPEQATRLSDHAYNVLTSLPDHAQDWLLIQSPGLAVNLVGSYRGKLDAQGQPINSQWVAADGSLNLPGGTRGRDLFTQGIQEGWIIRKSEREVVDDVLGRVAQAHTRRASYLWEATTDLQSFSLTNEQRRVNQRYIQSVPDWVEAGWAELGVQFTPGMSQLELAEQIDQRREVWRGYYVPFTTRQQMVVSEVENNLLRFAADRGIPNPAVAGMAGFLDEFRDLERYMSSEDLRVDDLPADVRNRVRDGWRRIIYDYDTGVSPSEWEAEFAGRWGSIDWDPPEFGTFDQWGDENGAFVADRPYIRVIDGDTVAVTFPDSGEETIIRLVGVNADDANPFNEEQHRRYIAQMERLSAVLDAASEIGFANPDPERFGAFSEVTEGNRRLLMVLYVNGQPVVNPDVFSANNPAGVSLSGDGVPENWITRMAS